MRKKIYARLVAGLLCGALLCTDASMMGVTAASIDLGAGTTVALTKQENEAKENDTSVIDVEKEGETEKKPEEETPSSEGTGTESKEEADGKEENPGTETEQPVEQPKEETGEQDNSEEDTEKSDSEKDRPEGETVPVEEEEEEEQATEEDLAEESVSENTLEENVAEEDELEAGAVVMASEENIASGEINESYGHITWVIDASGKLTVRGTGDYSSTASFRAPWLEMRDFITSAVIDITGITRTSLMFESCSNMTGADLSKLDTSQVTTMYGMFSQCKSLMRLDLTNFDTSNVTDMSNMFVDCSSLTQLMGSHFTTSQVKDMSNMFYGCRSLTQLDLNHFSNSQVENMRQMFYGCNSLREINMNYFNTGQVKNMNSMFMGCSSLKELDLSSFNTENVTDMGSMFYKCSDMTKLSLKKFNINKVTNLSGMFFGCESLLELDLSSFGTNELTNTESMFGGCSSLTKLDLRNFDTGRIENMRSMFSGCRSLEKLDISHFDTGKVTNMSAMFSECRSLKHLNLSHFDTTNVSSVGSMFNDCYGLTELDLSSFDFGKVTNDTWITMNCHSLTRIDTPYNIRGAIYLSGRTWYTSEGNEVTEMPKNLDHSVALGLNHIPSAEKPDNPPDDEDQEEEYVSKEEKFVQDVTQYSLANATDEKKKEIQRKLYDIMFKAYFAPMDQDPDKRVTFPGNEDIMKEKWKWRNETTVGSEITDPGLGVTIDYGEDNEAQGCMSYARFVSQYVHESIGRPNQKPSKEFKVRDMSGDIVDNVKKQIRAWADPGETIGFGDNVHFVVYLGDYPGKTEEEDGFYCISYGGGVYKGLVDHKVVVKKFTYTDFVDKYVMQKKATKLIIYDTNEGSYYGGEKLETNKAVRTKLEVDCPVEAVIELNGEKLDSRTPGMASFGNVARNGELITFDLTYTPTYNLSIIGTGEGIMTVTLTYYDEAGNQINQRKFVNIPVTSYTEIESSTFNYFGAFSLYVSDENGETSIWIAEGGETVYEPVNTNFDEQDYDPDGGIYSGDIPESGEIPQGLWISNIPDYTYTGAAIKPEVRVYDGEKRLKQGKDYTISYKNNTKAAQSEDTKPPTVVVKGKGNYSGTETQTFNITKRDIADTYVTKTFTDAYAPLANSKNPKLVFNAKCNNKALKKNTDYTLTVKDSSGIEVNSYAEEGTYSLIVKGTGTNYTGESILHFDVLNKIPVSKLKVNKIATVEYDGTSKRPQPVVKYGKMTLTKGTDYSLYYRNNREMGTATITITGKGDYFGTRNVMFTITGRQINKAKFAGFKTSFPYKGDTVYQSEAVLKYGEEELVLGTDYTTSYNNHLNKGKATVTYIGLGNYTGTLKKTYNIAAYNIASDVENRISLSTDEISTVYENGGSRPSLKVYDGMKLLTEGKDYTLSYQNHTAVTTQTTVKLPTITVKGKGNYTGVFAEKKTFAITPKAFTEVTITVPDVAASPKTGRYKAVPVLTDTNGKKLKAGTDYNKIYTYTYKDLTEKVLNNETEVTRNAGDPVEENDIIPANTVLCVHVTAKEGGNYTGEKAAEYRIVASPIDKARITVQNPAQNNRNLFLYTGQEIFIDKSNLVVKVGTEVLSDDQYEILEDTYKNNINKGTASVQIRGVGNLYGGTATVKFKIGTKGFQWFWRLFG